MDQVIRASSDEDYNKMALDYYEKYFTKNNLLIGIARISDFDFLIGSTILI
ncbi:MAG TPA: hypothetical protein VLM39_05360 [Ignavibacteriaceae bacterium]|nr:hypothetical protein [Ignavibacteriaceae bacterium]